jgi:hypothetical protein
LEQEELQRSVAFLGVTELICGVEVLPFSLAHLCRLQCVGSPFVSGGAHSPADVALFLWAVSPEYRPRSWFRRYLFVRKLRGIPFAEAVKGITDYLNEAFQDHTGGKSEGFSPSYWSGFASMVATLATEFHWSEADIMHMPLKRVWQYMRIVEKRHNPKAWFTNPSSKIRIQWQDECHKRN